MSEIKLTKLSKIISHALRHDPASYNLELDNDGWVKVGDLINSLRDLDIGFKNLSQSDLENMIESSEKKRHEIFEDRIRASYGHSVKNKIFKEAEMPPEYLFHATKKSFLKKIFSKGLLPMKRQYVHLSKNECDAIKVALRKTKEPILLRIKSHDAFNNGIKFYKEANNMWLADEIDAVFIEEVEIKQSL